jgi:hypothetical protein
LIAALFVETGGPYFRLQNVDPWDIRRDARNYNGPFPVVAHPPCERWGRYWGGGPNAHGKFKLGDDAGCFATAIAAVRRWGGVLEHPEASHAWGVFGLNKPPKAGGWIKADADGWTCCTEQGHYGHRARKATWLYAVNTRLPEMWWGPSRGGGQRLDEGFHSTAERRERRAAGQKPIKRLNRIERVWTPPAFRDMLIYIASTSQSDGEADAKS